jgi:hypothetical protein
MLFRIRYLSVPKAFTGVRGSCRIWQHLLTSLRRTTAPSGLRRGPEPFGQPVQLGYLPCLHRLVSYPTLARPPRSYAELNRRLDGGKCSTPLGLRQLPHRVDGATKDPAQDDYLGWGGSQCCAIPSEVLRIATSPNERDDSSSLLGDQDNSELG